MKQLALMTATLIVLLSSCVVGKQKYEDLETSRDAIQTKYDNLQSRFDTCQSEVTSLNEELVVRNDVLVEQRQEYQTLQEKLEDFKKTNTNMLTRLSELSIVDEAGAESIRKSLEIINQQNAYISDMASSMQRKDSLNAMLMMKLKRSLIDVDDNDVSIEVKKGVVYISLSDKMLYKSGSVKINPDADSVLAKIANVINDHEGFDVLVEGHTDDVPIKNINCIEDNWDLSAKRAVAVVRKLQNDYGVAPERLTAGGKSFYAPKTDNASPEGRSQNRRTEIIVLPKLDEFFQLMAPDNSVGVR
ncbi:MAG: OmpA family protein [Saprospiraceae bacterium]